MKTVGLQNICGNLGNFRWIESLKEQHLFEIEIFCKTIHFITVSFGQFNGYLLKKLLLTSTFELYCISPKFLDPEIHFALCHTQNLAITKEKTLLTLFSNRKIVGWVPGSFKSAWKSKLTIFILLAHMLFCGEQFIHASQSTKKICLPS